MFNITALNNLQFYDYDNNMQSKANSVEEEELSHWQYIEPLHYM